VERIRELANLLEAGIQDYEEQSNLLQQERLRFMKLSLTDNFGDDENSSEDSWLIHMKNIEETLYVRRVSIRQAIKECAEQIRQEEEAERAAPEEVQEIREEERLKQAAVEEVEKGEVDES